MDLQHITEEEYEAFLEALFGPVSRNTEEMEAINMGLFGFGKRKEQENFTGEETTGAHDPLCACDECIAFYERFAQKLTYDRLIEERGIDYANSWLSKQEG